MSAVSGKLQGNSRKGFVSAVCYTICTIYHKQLRQHLPNLFVNYPVALQHLYEIKPNSVLQKKTCFMEKC